MGFHLHLPEKETFYIILNGQDVVSRGSILPGNCLDTPHKNVLTFESKEEYLVELTKYNLPVIKSTPVGPISPFELDI